MTTELPIVNHQTPCRIDSGDAKWFQNKTLMMDEIGVYYLEQSKRYYVHDQVLAVASKDGRKAYPPGGKTQYRLFVKAKCDPEVQQYCLKA